MTDHTDTTDALDSAAEFARGWMLEMHEAGIFDMSEPTSHLKVLREAQELALAPVLEEAADVFISLVATCVEQHWSMSDLAAAVRAKVEINRHRKWQRQVDGTLQHVAEASRG